LAGDQPGFFRKMPAFPKGLPGYRVIAAVASLRILQRREIQGYFKKKKS